jgi:hypothetical protein
MRALHLSIGVLITLALLAAVFSQTSLTKFAEIVWGTDRQLLNGYLVLALLGLGVRTARYRLISRDILGASPSWWDLFMISGVRNAAVDFLPARLGEGVFIYLLNRVGVNLLTAASIFGLCLFIDILVLILLMTVLIGAHLFLPNVQMPDLFSPSMALKAMFALACLGALASLLLVKVHVILRPLALFLQRRGDNGGKFVSALGRLVHRVESDFAALSQAHTYPMIILLTVLLRILKYGAYYSLLLGVIKHWGISSADVSFFLASVAFIVAEASASLPASGIMGFGAYEGVWSAVFSLSHVELSSASVTTVILAVHVITQIFGYAVGLLCGASFLVREFVRERS